MQVSDLIPRTGFFPQYLKWVTRLTDAPAVYHITSGLAAISTIISKYSDGMFMFNAPDGEQMISRFPTNLWTLIVGPSGDRKSTAMDFATSCVAPICGEISAISGSPEATFDLVSKRPDVFFYHSEGSTLFSQLQASYWMQGQGFLCDLYDGRDEYTRTLTGQRTKKNPSPDPITIRITKPRVTILIGIAPDLLDQSRKSDWTGGLIGRMLLVYGECTQYDETPRRTDEKGQMLQTAWLEKLRVSVAKMGSLQIAIRPEALQTYMNWARDLNASTLSRPSKIRPLFRRLPVHVLRVACLFAISSFYDTITMDTILPALRLGDYSRRSIERVGDLLAEDPIMRNAVRIRDMILRAPGQRMPVRQISDELRMSWPLISPALTTLVTTGKAKIRLDEDNAEAKIIELVPSRYDEPQQAENEWGGG